MTRLRTPARAIESPISIQMRIAVSQESVIVPGEAMCSFDLPTGWIGSEGHRQALGQQLDRAADHALADAVIGIDGQMRPVLLDGADRQHGDPVLLAAEKIGRLHLVPVGAGEGGHRHHPSSGELRAFANRAARS